MKKTLLALLMVLFLSFVLVGCSSTTSTTDVEDKDYASEESELPESQRNLEPPVSNVSGGTGLPGTWVLEEAAEGGTFEMVLALNDDDTFELYSNGEAPGFLSGSYKSLLAGTYTDEDNKIVLAFDDPTEAAIELNLNSYTFEYTLDGNSLTLVNDGTTYQMTRED